MKTKQAIDECRALRSACYRANKKCDQLRTALKLLMLDLHYDGNGGWRIGPLDDGPGSRIALARHALEDTEQ